MFEQEFLEKFVDVTHSINIEQVKDVVYGIRNIRNKGGRLFILGVGGSAANAAHAVNDFRKLTNIETYSPTDNVSELTARINDEGWNSSYLNWLVLNNLTKNDGVLALSVGGGNVERNISMNMVYAMEHAKMKKSMTACIVGKKGGEIYKIAKHGILVPDIYPELVTPFAEAMQSVLLHLIVSHPALQENKTTW